MGRPMLPALLSLGGAILPSLLLTVFVASWFSTQSTDQVGGAGSPLTYIIVLELITVFSIIVILSLVFSLLLLFDKRRHKTWGTVVVAWYSLITGLAVVSALILFGVGVTYSPWSVALVLTPLLGVAGGVLGMLWKPVEEEKKTDNRIWNVTPP